MFQGCFTYNKKGLCYYYILETKQEKRDAEIEIAIINEELELILREEWELVNGMQRMSLRNLPSAKPQWRQNQKNGKLSQQVGGSGINQYCY